MVSYTPNYNLGKPNGAPGGDFVDISVLDTNMDTIDTQIKNRANETASLGTRATDLETRTTNVEGRVTTLENKPYVALSASQNVVTNTVSPISWTTEVEDGAGFHVAGSTDIVVPASMAGIYLYTIQTVFPASAGTGIRQTSVRKNGGTLHSFILQNPPAGAAYIDETRLIRLIVGDILSMVAYQESGGTLLVASAIQLIRLSS
jgi:hypothetical protein